MSLTIIRRLASMLLILVPIAFTLCFTLLQIAFEYPDILRQPTSDVLHKFQAGGSYLILLWYGMTLTALLFVPIVVFTHYVIARAHTSAGL
ncbi:MAG: DUF4386 family protein, partial [Chloroflexaceae bacterium]|nr:DUF4386 family protein [Chloroflexaceae bacterium]